MPPSLLKAVPRVPARPAATTLILRDAAPGLEVLMVRRSPNASFMPGAYVFPGGAVDAADGAADVLARNDEDGARLRRRIGDVLGVGDQGAAFAVAGLRECFEECGLWLGADTAPAAGWADLRAQLHAGQPLAALAAAHGLALSTGGLQPWAHWTTPVGLPKRFDTVFFVCRAPRDQVPEVDAGETTTLAWVHPPQALADHKRGEFAVEFATISILKSLDPYARGSVQALLDHAARLPSVPSIHPRLKLDGEGRMVGVMLPGQPGYDDAIGD
jgi:8-oxo-dGTP pyrophosphatase MutT (NUDIX family)